MKWFRILGYLIISGSIFILCYNIWMGSMRDEYLRGRWEATVHERQRCFNAHSQCLLESMSEDMKREIAWAKYKNRRSE